MYRQLGVQVLSKYITSEKNVKLLEKNVNEVTNNQEDYKKLILELVNHKRGGMSSKDILKLLKSKKVLEDGSVYEEYRLKLKEHDGFLIKPFEVDEGVLECGKCGSNKTISYTKQTRSGDESTSVFALCYNCNNKWKM